MDLYHRFFNLTHLHYSIAECAIVCNLSMVSEIMLHVSKSVVHETVYLPPGIV
jgi:hypothetical protein